MPLPKINHASKSDVPQEGGKTATAIFDASRARESKGAMIISPAMRDRAVEALDDGLRAVRRYWDKQAEKWIEEPDFATRTKCAELTLAYAEGRPVERQVKLTGDVTGYDDRLEKLIATPEGLRIAQALGLVKLPEKPATSGRGTEKNALIETGEKSGKSEDVDSKQVAP